MSFPGQTFSVDFDDMLAQTVTYKPFSSRTAGGTVTFGSASTYQARVVNGNKQTRDLQGNVVQAAYEVWIASTGVLSPRGQYTLPDGTTPPVLNVSVYPDENGNFHNKIYFGYA